MFRASNLSAVNSLRGSTTRPFFFPSNTAPPAIVYPRLPACYRFQSELDSTRLECYQIPHCWTLTEETDLILSYCLGPSDKRMTLHRWVQRARYLKPGWSLFSFWADWSWASLNDLVIVLIFVPYEIQTSKMIRYVLQCNGYLSSFTNTN